MHPEEEDIPSKELVSIQCETTAVELVPEKAAEDSHSLPDLSKACFPNTSKKKNCKGY